MVLVHCNITNNGYLPDPRAWYTFVPSKSFDELLEISPKKIYISKFILFRVFIDWCVIYRPKY